MIYVTHDQVEAMTMADQIVVLNGGRIEQVEAHDALPHAGIGVCGGLHRLACHEHRRCRTALGPGGGAAEGAARIGIRPEHIELGPTGIPVTLRMKEQLGGESYLYARTEDGIDVVVKTDGDDPHAPGDALHLTLPAGASTILRGMGQRWGRPWLTPTGVLGGAQDGAQDGAQGGPKKGCGKINSPR
jgi:ABC-type sugar transport system ATPase subunit